MDFKFTAGRNKGDPEKVVIPTIMYIGMEHPKFKGSPLNGFMLAIGWWDWNVKVAVYWNKKNNG